MTIKRLILLVGIIYLVTMVQSVRATEQICLNGRWEIAFDDRNEGKKGHWENDTILSQQKLQPIEVPSSWENVRVNYEGVAWYRKQF